MINLIDLPSIHPSIHSFFFFFHNLLLLYADRNGVVEVLAEDPQSKRGDVPERVGGDPGRHRAVGVRQSHGAALPTAGQVCVQPTLPGPTVIHPSTHF